jgi:sugar phosphate isomerase/epimerase
VRRMGFHQMNALELTPVELVPIAHEVGCQYICVFVCVPLPQLPFTAMPPESAPELLRRLDATGIEVENVEFFPLTEDVDVESYRAPLELGAQIGGRRLVTVIDDTVRTRAAENLARLCDLGAEYGLKVGLEFMPLTRGCPNLATALELLGLVGKPNLGLATDPLHIIRSGGSFEDLLAVPPELFGYAQLCDGPDLVPRDDYWVEVFERLVPGEGVFPLATFLDALPAATPVDVEVPSVRRREAGGPPLELARRSAKASRELLEQAQPTR